MIVYAIVLGMISLIAYYHKRPYPRLAIIAASEPLNRMLLYLAAYMLSYYNTIVSLVFMIGILRLHIDYTNYVENV